MSANLQDYDYPLPEALIAQAPLAERDSCKLMVLDAETGATQHHVFRDISSILKAGDLLILNNTKVIPARLRAYGASDRKFEVLLLAPKESLLHRECLVRPAAKLEKENFELRFLENVRGKFARLDDYLWTVQFSGVSEDDFSQWLDRHGELPLPPYIHRTPDDSDKENYQTVFAQTAGSVAAPTAGLHFTETLLAQVKAQGVEIAHVTLHVGYGTFSPIRTDDLAVHQMHAETYEVPASTWKKIQETRARGGRVIACGTTAVRALESVESLGLCGNTNLFLQPGSRFSVVDALITNFHLPKSSLLVLVSAFAGREKVLNAYREARDQGYRFFSYGDAMLILRPRKP